MQFHYWDWDRDVWPLGSNCETDTEIFDLQYQTLRLGFSFQWSGLKTRDWDGYHSRLSLGLKTLSLPHLIVWSIKYCLVNFITKWIIYISELGVSSIKYLFVLGICEFVPTMLLNVNEKGIFLRNCLTTQINKKKTSKTTIHLNISVS